MQTVLNGYASINDIIKIMTVEEKAKLLTGETYFSTHSFEKYAIPSIRFLDSAAGINLGQYYIEAGTLVEKEAGTLDVGEIREGEGSVCATLTNMHITKELREKGIYSDTLSPQAKVIAEYMKRHIIPNGKLPTAFPCGLCLGASWNRTVVRDVGSTVAKEAAAYKIDVLLGTPNVNILRDPLNGRYFEGISEDPYVVTQIAPEMVRGIQNAHIGADVKHFAANNQETLRQGIDEHIPERALYEIYFPGFKACVQEAKPKTVMSAYNRINGECCAENHWLLTEILKEDWGFDGFVISDWGGCYYQVKALNAGNDLDMPGPRNIQRILDAVADGTLKMETLNASCRRVLSVIVDIMEMRKHRSNDFDRAESLAKAYALAAESITLLKNEAILPLPKTCHVSFFGEKSNGFIAAGEGSARVITDQKTSLVDETVKIVGADHVEFGSVSNASDVVVITASKPSAEGVDHTDMELPQMEKEMLLNAIAEAKKAGKKIVLVLNTAAPVETSDFIHDVDALLWIYYPGSMGGKVVADILFGNVNPSGKLTVTYPKRYRDCPSYGYFPGEFESVHYGEDIYVGYRHFDLRDIEPLFPFGFGLSYTQFKISDLEMSSEKMDLDNDGDIRIAVKVKNVGSVAGKEVVQLYIYDEKSLLPKPVKELKGFEKVFLRPGEERVVTFTLHKKDLGAWDVKYHEWVTEPGWYKVLIGNSSRNIACESRFRACGHSRYDFGPDTHMIRISRRPDVLEAIGKCLTGVMEMSQLLSCVTLASYSPFAKVWDFLIKPRARKASRDPDKLFQEVCKVIKDIDSGEA